MIKHITFFEVSKAIQNLMRVGWAININDRKMEEIYTHRYINIVVKFKVDRAGIVKMKVMPNELSVYHPVRLDEVRQKLFEDRFEELIEKYES